MYILHQGQPDSSKAADIVLVYSMLAISFPLGLIGLLPAYAYGMWIQQERGTGYLDIIILWSFFAASGAYQWLFIFPKLTKPASKENSF